MPYIKIEDREKLQEIDSIFPDTVGELNYCITKLCLNYLNKLAMTKYETLNGIIGALECAKQEFYRKIISEYENLKCQQNGEVY
jgi:hypothetical protein